MPTQREFWNGPVANVWVTHADRLDALIEPLGRAALEALAPRPGERVLDIGCGAGATTRALAAHTGPDHPPVGVDLSLPLVELARTRGGGPHYHHADAGAEPLPGPFDAAFSRFGVMFFEDPAAAFANLRAAMHPHGRLAFVCWRPLRENPWAALPLQAALPLLAEPPAPPRPDAPGPFAFGDAARVRALLEAAGWTRVEHTPLETRYPLGATPAEAADFSLKLGPLAHLVRERDLDPAPFRAAVEALWQQHADPSGEVAPTAACWVVTARAG